MWGREGPDFESMEEALAIHGIITGRYNEILRCLDTEPESFDPVFWEGPKGEVIVTDWAAGFLDAVGLRPKAWEGGGRARGGGAPPAPRRGGRGPPPPPPPPRPPRPRPPAIRRPRAAPG